eukprot:scaffold663_cov341-Pavlova_lutheri.AAC.4
MSGPSTSYRPSCTRWSASDGWGCFQSQARWTVRFPGALSPTLPRRIGDECPTNPGITRTDSVGKGNPRDVRGGDVALVARSFPRLDAMVHAIDGADVQAGHAKERIRRHAGKAEDPVGIRAARGRGKAGETTQRKLSQKPREADQMDAVRVRVVFEADGRRQRSGANDHRHRIPPRRFGRRLPGGGKRIP